MAQSRRQCGRGLVPVGSHFLSPVTGSYQVARYPEVWSSGSIERSGCDRVRGNRCNASGHVDATGDFRSCGTRDTGCQSHARDANRRRTVCGGNGGVVFRARPVGQSPSCRDWFKQPSPKWSVGPPAQTESGILSEIYHGRSGLASRRHQPHPTTIERREPPLDLCGVYIDPESDSDVLLQPHTGRHDHGAGHCRYCFQFLVWHSRHATCQKTSGKRRQPLWNSGAIDPRCSEAPHRRRRVASILVLGAYL